MQPSKDDLDRRREDVFSGALRNTRDVTSQFWADFGEQAERISQRHKFDDSFKQVIRQIMSRAQPPLSLFRLEDVAEPFRDEAARLLDRGDVAAVDGTDAIPPISYMTTSSYVVAVGLATRRERGKPCIQLTETSTRYLDPDEVRVDDTEGLRALCDTLDRFREQGSWTTTFREHAERRHALDHPHVVTIIDGPIFTQNLITQEAGRALLAEIISIKDQHFLGVIKDVSQASAQVTWCARTLERGEGFVVGYVGDHMQMRFKRQSPAVLDWVLSHLGEAHRPDGFVRVVYRPGEKAFAFECRLSDLGLATGILLEDASPTIHHETPMLLELIDSQMRGGFRGREIRDAVIGRLMRKDWRMGIDAIDERTLR